MDMLPHTEHHTTSEVVHTVLQDCHNFTDAGELKVSKYWEQELTIQLQLKFEMCPSWQRFCHRMLHQ